MHRRHLRRSWLSWILHHVAGGQNQTSLVPLRPAGAASPVAASPALWGFPTGLASSFQSADVAELTERLSDMRSTFDSLQTQAGRQTLTLDQLQMDSNSQKSSLR